MSALSVPTVATMSRHAQTTTGALCVIVLWDTLATGRTVQVHGDRISVCKSHCFTLVLIGLVSDQDECMLQSHSCHGNAECSNTNGSFICACDAGFDGNGTFCAGKAKKKRKARCPFCRGLFICRMVVSCCQLFSVLCCCLAL